MVTKAALLLGQSLLFFTLGTAPIHFPTAKIILKEETTTGAFGCSWFHCRFTTGDWAFKDGFTIAAPVFPLEGGLTFLTSFNSHYLLQNLN